jgi:uncharacterized protein YkwD
MRADRRTMMAGLSLLALAACAGRTPSRALGPDGLPLPTLFTITEADALQIPGRMLAGLNSLRSAAGAPPLALDAQLASAAATHSRDMSVQNRPWHYGSDGSTPIDRLRRVGYPGALVGEAISETYEDDTTTLAAWAQEPETRTVLLDPRATRMGVAWFQEPAGKIWWTMVLGA